MKLDLVNVTLSANATAGHSPAQIITRSLSRAVPYGSVSTRLVSNFMRKNTVGLCQRFVRANIVPSAAHLPNTKRDSLVKPLHQAPRLIRIVAFREILSNQRQR